MIGDPAIAGQTSMYHFVDPSSAMEDSCRGNYCEGEPSVTSECLDANGVDRHLVRASFGSIEVVSKLLL